MKFIPAVSVPTIARYDVYTDGKFDFSTYEKAFATGAIEMGWGNVEVKIVDVETSLVKR